MPQARFVFNNVIPKAEAVKQLVNGGEIDLVTEITPAEAEQIVASDNAYLVESQAKTVLMGVFNQQGKEVWRNADARRALNHAVQRQALIDNHHGGYGIVMPAIIKEGEFGYNSALVPYAYDQSAAEKGLKDAGVDSLTIVTGEGHKASAEGLAKQFGEVGIDAQVKVGEPEGDWDVWLVEHFDWSPEFPSGVVHREYFGDSGGFRRMDVDSEVQGQIEALRSTPDHVEQDRLTQQLEQTIYDNALGLFLFAPFKLYGVADHVYFEPYESTVLELAETHVIDGK